jgi:hypothetical protein
MPPRIHGGGGTGKYGGIALEVEADGRSQWRNRLKIFKREFPGQSDFGMQRTILNPLVLDLEVDSESGEFIASTDSTLHIDNDALRYRPHLVPKDFRFCGRWKRLHSAEQSIVATLAFIDYTVYPRYEEMIAENEDKAQRWHKNRQVAYGG